LRPVGAFYAAFIEAPRIDGAVRNVDGWYDTFSIKPGNALWVAPAERTRIW
jgi:predicted metalloendopeptidase